MNLFLSRLNEPQRRWYLGLLSQSPDAPSDRQLALITGLDTDTIHRGRLELAAGLPELPPGRQRRPGGDRPSAEKKIPLLVQSAGRSLLHMLLGVRWLAENGSTAAWAMAKTTWVSVAVSSVCRSSAACSKRMMTACASTTSD